MLETLKPQPADALLALIKLHNADPRSTKIDLGVGVYRTGAGDTPVFGAIKAAERVLHILRADDFGSAAIIGSLAAGAAQVSVA